MELIWVFSLILLSKANRTEISIRAPREIRYKQDNLSIFCNTPLSVHRRRINFIQLTKDSGSGFKPIALFNRTVGNRNKEILRHVPLIGPIQRNRSKFLYYVPAEKVKCSDRGTYRCEIGYGVRNTSISTSLENRIEIRVKPSHLNPIKTLPESQYGRFPNGTTVTLICNGTVGSPPRDLRWCYRTEDGYFLTYFKTDAIIQGTASPKGCQNIRQSTLTYTINDEKIVFLCEIATDISCGEGRVMVNYTIHMCNSTDCFGYGTSSGQFSTATRTMTDMKSFLYHTIPSMVFVSVLLQHMF